MNTGRGHLFSPEILVVLQRHDYGGALNGDEDGHEFPFVQAGTEKRPVPLIQCKGGPSVSFRARFNALQSAARMYARYNRATGLQHAVEVPEYREELEARYDNVVLVTQRTVTKAAFSQYQERKVLRPLLMEKELIDAGYDPVDVEAAVEDTLREVQKLIGIELNARTRDKNLRRIRRE